MPAAVALAISSCASSTDFPVPRDCAAVAGNPAASRSVRLALNTASTLPKNSTRRLARLGPSPGVRVNLACGGPYWDLRVSGGIGHGTSCPNLVRPDRRAACPTRDIAECKQPAKTKSRLAVTRLIIFLEA